MLCMINKNFIFKLSVPLTRVVMSFRSNQIKLNFRPTFNPIISLLTNPQTKVVCNINGNLILY